MGKSKSNKKKQQKQQEDEVVVDEVNGDDSPLEYLDDNEDKEEDTTTLTKESIIVEEKGNNKEQDTPEIEEELDDTLPSDEIRTDGIEAVDTATTSVPNVDDIKTDGIEAVDTAITSIPNVDDIKTDGIEAVDTATTGNATSKEDNTVEAVDKAMPSTPVKEEEREKDVTPSSLNDNSTLTTPKTKVNPYSPSPIPSTSSSPIDAGDMATNTATSASYVKTPSTADVDNNIDDQTRFKWKVQNTGYLQSSLRASLSSDYTPIRSQGITTVVDDTQTLTDNRIFEDPLKVKYPLEQLLGLAENLPTGVNPAKREAYLTPDEFCNVFGMDMDKFYLMPLWKQRTTKKAAGLF